MNRIAAFASRNIKELMREPLSYIFCVAFPIVMLLVMTLVNSSIPEEAGMTLFRIDKLSGGILVFGQTFVMLFATLTVSQDRSGSFLVRLYASPMRSMDFIAGYALPMLVISLAQALLTFAVSFIISLITGNTLSVPGMLMAILSAIPSAVMFTALGILFGSLFGEKSAPGLCSVIISLGSFLGCIWFDAESTGGVLLTVCKIFPFFYCTKCVRAATALDLTADGYLLPLAVTAAWAAVLSFLAIFVFGRRMRADLS